LDEGSLVTRFGLSRTPVREALIRLAADGLVTMLPNRRAQVSPLDLGNFPRFVEALNLLQRAIMRLAALRRSDDDLAAIATARDTFEAAVAEQDAMTLSELNLDFHLTFGAAAHNSYLASYYQRLLDERMRLLRIPFAYDPEGGTGTKELLVKVVEEHRAMVEAIVARDAGNRRSSREHPLRSLPQPFLGISHPQRHRRTKCRGAAGMNRRRCLVSMSCGTRSWPGQTANWPGMRWGSCSRG
jgi:DNA-binding GntR family transcriptional regulator